MAQVELRRQSIEGSMNSKKGCKLFRPGLIQGEGSKIYAVNPLEKGLVKEFEKEGERLGIFFNGMQRSNTNISVALFTDNKTKSTFGVESGQSVMAKLIETRKRFRFARTRATLTTRTLAKSQLDKAHSGKMLGQEHHSEISQ